MTPTPERTGILGGTFDPVHLGHLQVALQCRRLLRLDRVLLVPSGSPPHRRAPSASSRDRLALVRAAVAEEPGLEASDLEVLRPGPSYTIDTLRRLRDADASASYVLLLGVDAALEFRSWRDSREVGKMVDIAVFNRSGSETPTQARLTTAGLPADVTVLEVDSPDISATELRADLAAGRDVSNRLPASVLSLVRELGLYRVATAGGG